MDVRTFTVGPVQENCFVARRDGADRALIVDPGDEADRILGAVDELGIGIDAILLTHTHFDHVGAVAPVAKATNTEVWVPEIEKPVLADIMSFVPWSGFGPYESWDAEHTVAGGEKLELDVKAILLTHTHFDHVGAVAPVARATGAEVWCPELEVGVLADINSFVPWPGFGPFESYEADETVAGGETLELAGLELDVIFTPGHSPGHVTYSVRGEGAIFSGDVLFQGSVGRVDLPGGDGPTLIMSIRKLLDSHPDTTTVYPGHIGTTTLGAERATNPFLAELAR